MSRQVLIIRSYGTASRPPWAGPTKLIIKVAFSSSLFDFLKCWTLFAKHYQNGRLMFCQCDKKLVDTEWIVFSNYLWFDAMEIGWCAFPRFKHMLFFFLM